MSILLTQLGIFNILFLKLQNLQTLVELVLATQFTKKIHFKIKGQIFAPGTFY